MQNILNKFFLSTLLVFLVISADGHNKEAGIPETNFIENRQAAVSIHLTRHDTDHFNSVVNRVSSSDQVGEFTVQFDQSTWKTRKKLSRVKDEVGAYDLVCTFQYIAGQSPATAVSVDFSFDQCSADNYVLMPAAVYGGNRVKSFRVPYIPFMLDFNDMGPDRPQIISDVPRLNDKAGPTWAETSLLLTEVEIPGIYIDLDKNQAFAFDQIDVLSLKNKKGKVEIDLSNPTKYDVKVEVLLESKGQVGKTLSQNSYLKWQGVFVPAGKSMIANLKNK